MDSGLENVIAAETALSDVKGDIGELIIKGWYVEKLAASMAFEDVAHLLWQSAFEDLPSVQTLGARLGEARVIGARGQRLRPFRRLVPRRVID